MGGNQSLSAPIMVRRIADATIGVLFFHVTDQTPDRSVKDLICGGHHCRIHLKILGKLGSLKKVHPAPVVLFDFRSIPSLPFTVYLNIPFTRSYSASSSATFSA